jgi:hypothetical protein
LFLSLSVFSDISIIPSGNILFSILCTVFCFYYRLISVSFLVRSHISYRPLNSAINFTPGHVQVIELFRGFSQPVQENARIQMFHLSSSF